MEIQLKDEALILRPGDIIVLQADDSTSQDEADEWRAAFGRVGITAVVLPSQLHVVQQRVIHVGE